MGPRPGPASVRVGAGDGTGDHVRVQLAYGEQGLTVDLPDDRTTVVEPRYVPGAEDPAAVLRSALRKPVAGTTLRTVLDNLIRHTGEAS